MGRGESERATAPGLYQRTNLGHISTPARSLLTQPITCTRGSDRLEPLSDAQTRRRPPYRSADRCWAYRRSMSSRRLARPWRRSKSFRLLRDRFTQFGTEIDQAGTKVDWGRTRVWHKLEYRRPRDRWLQSRHRSSSTSDQRGRVVAMDQSCEPIRLAMGALAVVTAQWIHSSVA